MVALLTRCRLCGAAMSHYRHPPPPLLPVAPLPGGQQLQVRLAFAWSVLSYLVAQLIIAWNEPIQLLSCLLPPPAISTQPQMPPSSPPRRLRSCLLAVSASM